MPGRRTRAGGGVSDMGTVSQRRAAAVALRFFKGLGMRRKAEVCGGRRELRKAG